MIYGSIDSEDTFRPLLWNETFTLAINKIKAMSEQTPLGIERIIGDRCFINVHAYDTKSESECLFEGHRNTIDMQYIISGGEYSDWALKKDLRENGKYDEDKDFQFFERGDNRPRCRHSWPRSCWRRGPRSCWTPPSEAASRRKGRTAPRPQHHCVLARGRPAPRRSSST